MTFNSIKNFKKAYNKIIEQGEPSITSTEPRKCLYRGPNNLKCFAGHLIPEELETEIDCQTWLDIALVEDNQEDKIIYFGQLAHDHAVLSITITNIVHCPNYFKEFKTVGKNTTFIEAFKYNCQLIAKYEGFEL